MEKVIYEIIQDGFTGIVYEDLKDGYIAYISEDNQLIYKNKWGNELDGKCATNKTRLDVVYEPMRRKYPFGVAFEYFKKGYKIESVKGGYEYKIIGGTPRCLCVEHKNWGWSIYDEFSNEDMEDEWYINAPLPYEDRIKLLNSIKYTNRFKEILEKL